jgi:hypothetical protein
MQLGRLAFTEEFMSFQHLVLRTYTFQKFFFDLKKKKPQEKSCGI